MKKILTGIAAVLMLAACNSNSYKVSGTIKGLEENAEILLCSIVDGNSLNPIDTAYAKGGKYSFSGETSQTDVAVLAFDVDGQMTTCTFFLEPGNITVNYDDQIQFINGTETNKCFQKFYDQVTALNNEAIELDQQMQQASDAGQDMELYKAQMTELQNRYQTIVENSIRDNVGNLFGVQQIIDNYDLFEPEQIKEFIGMLDPKFADNPYISELDDFISSQLLTGTGNPYRNFTAKKLDVKHPDKELTDQTFGDIVEANKLILLDFWASWCMPCIAELPTITALYNDYAGKGFEIVSVSVDEDQDEWKNAVAEHEMNWIQLINTDMEENSPAILYSVSTIPSTFLIDQNGTIVARGLRGEELKAFVSDYLK